MKAARIILAAACIALVCKPGAFSADVPAAPTRDVLIDVSHEWPGPASYLAGALSQAGIAATDSHAYLLSLRDTLADYKLIVLWQQSESVAYDDLEYGVLLDYVKGGGRLLLVSNATGWMAARRVRTPRDYPLLQLAHRFGLRLNKEHEELALGSGKIIHQHCGSDCILRKIFSAKREERREAAAFVEQLMSAPKSNVKRVDRLPPEIPIKESGVALLYAQPMKESGEWARKALPQVLRYLKESVHAEPEGLVLRVVPASYLPVLPGFRSDVPLLGGESNRLGNLTTVLVQGWMQPKQSRVSYPGWVDPAWARAVARDALRRFDVPGQDAQREKSDAACLRERDPDLTAIDLAAAKPSSRKDAIGAAAYDGKCDYVFQTLLKEQGAQVIVRFRDLVFLYHESGKLPSPITSTDAVKMLSLAVGKDLFPWFRSIGMKVQPVPLDFSEPDRLRAEQTSKPPAPAP